MAPVFKSGAFIQQCFASHRLCLILKQLSGPDTVLLTCSSCNLQHRLTLRGVSGSRLENLAQCAAVHSTALGVREMDVLQEFVRIRCGECRLVYDLEVAEFETHQR